MTSKKFEVPKGIPLKSFSNMTIREIKKLDRDYKKLIQGGKK
jgi:hypothetical protein